MLFPFPARPIVAVVAALSVAALLASCGGSGDAEDFPRVVSLGEGDVFPAIVNDSVTVGDNRLLLQITDKDDALVLGGVMHLTFYDLNGEDARVHSETAARFVPLELGYIDEQSDGAREVTGNGGAYVAMAYFEHAGDWGAMIDVTAGGETYEDVPFRFTVRERSSEPMVGDAAPPSRQAVLGDVASINEIDSSEPARPDMHTITIADAVASGRPAVIAFATPAFCTSRVCAPVMDTVMDPLFAEYGDQASFIHVEPYVLRDLRNGFLQNPVPATREWGVQSEPWIFVVGRDGRVLAKFQGVMALDEVEMALERALGAS